MVTTPRQNSAVELFDIKNSYYIGNYQQCIKEAQKLKPSTPEVALERDVFLYRAYLAQKKMRIVLDEINHSSPNELQPLRLLAEYLSATSNQTKLLSALDEQMEKGHAPSVIANQVAATIYCLEANYESALRALHQDDDLESSAITVVIYLAMDRVDLARKELKAMQEKDEDATLTQLATAWVNIALGGDKLQDAFYIFQELVDKYGVSSQLLVGQAACQVGLGGGRWEEADTLLHDALELDNNDADAAINALLVNHHFNKHTEANRMLTQLKESSGKHRFVKEVLAKEAEFDRLEAQYSAELSVK